MRPIPKSLLIHSGQLQSVPGKDSWGKGTLSDTVNLKHIRLEPTTKYVRDKQNNEIQLAAVMFYDCYNSRPRNQDFHSDQIFSIHGERYQVQLVEPLYDENKLHHYEIGLVRHV